MTTLSTDSQIDAGLKYDNQSWVVSLQTQKGKADRIIIEGMQQGESFWLRFDIFTKDFQDTKRVVAIGTLEEKTHKYTYSGENSKSWVAKANDVTKMITKIKETSKQVEKENIDSRLGKNKEETSSQESETKEEASKYDMSKFTISYSKDDETWPEKMLAIAGILQRKKNETSTIRQISDRSYSYVSYGYSSVGNVLYGVGVALVSVLAIGAGLALGAYKDAHRKK